MVKLLVLEDEISCCRSSCSRSGDVIPNPLETWPFIRKISESDPINYFRTDLNHGKKVRQGMIVQGRPCQLPLFPTGPFT